MSKGAFQTRLGQMGEIPNFQQTPPMAHTGNYFMPPKPNYLPVEKQAMARVDQPMSIQQPIANIMASGISQQPRETPVPISPPMTQPIDFSRDRSLAPPIAPPARQTHIQVPSLLTQPEIPGAPIQTPPQSLLQPQDYRMESQGAYGRPMSRGSLPPINLFR